MIGSAAQNGQSLPRLPVLNLLTMLSQRGDVFLRGARADVCVAAYPDGRHVAG
jgi:hypothetical protein